MLNCVCTDHITHVPFTGFPFFFLALNNFHHRPVDLKNYLTSRHLISNRARHGSWASRLTLHLKLLDLPSFTVLGKDAAFCFKQETHYNTTLKGGLDAGEYTPWEPRGVDFMTVDLCTKHCCKSPDTDAVFLLNR